MKLELPRPSVVTAVAGAVTLASIAATGGFLLGRYPALPLLLPTHFRAGTPDLFAVKSYALVFAPFWTQLILAVVIGGIAALLLSRGRSDGVADEQADDRRRMLHAAEAIALLGMVWISFQAVTAWRLTVMWARWAGGMGPAYNVALATAAVLSVVIGARAMTKIGRSAPRHRDDNRLWRLKALYFNPADPALFAPARDGSGLTLNFGRPLAIALMLAILLVGLGGPLLLARSLLR